MDDSNGGNDGDVDDVFRIADRALQIQRQSTSRTEGTDNDTDDWESASDVCLDSTAM